MPQTIAHRKLGQGLEVSALGLGCMGMSWAYTPTESNEGEAVIARAIELGVTFFDTAEIYGPFENEKLLGRAIRGKRDGLVIATKFGFKLENGKNVGVDSSPANLKRVCDEALGRLGIESIDLFYQHRVDPNVPIEETVGAMAELKQSGKIKHLGLSECSAATLRKAHATYPISALQSEFSLWERSVEAEILPTCRELGIGFVAYSPLGRGFLSGEIRSIDDLAADDWRRSVPRFQGENFKKNLEVVEEIKKLSEKKSVTPSQLA
ncbi:MAG TPA: aldo/keto reductase, partial [Tepidisphaeraceae bacterium]|nr:aldo/keto reductase [Tepidisphaeraceae bacterium]